MAKSKLISVITPSYNGDKTIHRAIESLLLQSYCNIQYIIVDDCSHYFNEDSITEFVNKHNSGNITDFIVLKNEENLGTVKTLNIGLAHAKGDIIFSLADDDCFFDSEVLTDWVAEFDKTGADVITAKRAVYDPSLKHFISIEPHSDEILAINELSPFELFEKMSKSNFIFGCSTARTKKFLDSFGRYDETYRLIEDYSSNMKMLRYGTKIHFFDRVVIKYRLGGVSTSTRINKNYLKESDLLFENEILPYVSDKDLATENYIVWKNGLRDAARHTKFSIRLAKHKNCKLAKFFVYFFYHMHHPFRTLKRVLKSPNIITSKLNESDSE